jgi:alkanesulfonate monooxygenase SsuD/methylene tetrahydromethanopterin reductase-like flavin-dependent oxidoreductase (luciferase family)
MHLTVCINGSGYHPVAWRLLSRATYVNASEFRELTALAESADFAAAFFGVRFFDRELQSTGRLAIAEPDAMPLISSLVAHTARIGLGMTYPMERAEPYNIARSLATLDLLSLGRTAWIIDLDRKHDYSREAECIEVVRKLWDSWEDDAFTLDKGRGVVADSDKVRRIDHAGAHFSVRGPLNVPRPAQGQPVLVLMDPGDEAPRKLAAAVADLFVMNCDDGDAARRLRQDLRSYAVDASRDPDTLRALMNVFAVLGSTEGEARKIESELKEAVDPALALALVQSKPGMFGWKFVGTPAQLANRLADFHAAGCCDGFNLIPAILPNDLRLFAEHTIPALRHRNCLPAMLPGATLRDRLGLRHPRSRYAAQREPV